VVVLGGGSVSYERGTPVQQVFEQLYDVHEMKWRGWLDTVPYPYLPSPFLPYPTLPYSTFPYPTLTNSTLP